MAKKAVDPLITGLMQKTGVSNVNACPKFVKATINVGMGTLLRNTKDYSEIAENVKKLTGQKPVVTHAKKAISNFKIREGMPVGLKVTLRGKRMTAFIEKLVKVVFPRMRDFRGFSKNGFDAQGNYTVGIREVTVFPEVNPDNVDKIHGIEISLTTTAWDKDSGIALLEAHGWPFKKDVQ